MILNDFSKFPYLHLYLSQKGNIFIMLTIFGGGLRQSQIVANIIHWSAQHAPSSPELRYHVHFLKHDTCEYFPRIFYETGPARRPGGRNYFLS